MEKGIRKIPFIYINVNGTVPGSFSVNGGPVPLLSHAAGYL